MLMREGANPELIIVCSGLVEIFTCVEGTEFVIERLGPGSVINHRAVFFNEPMRFNIRCAAPSSFYIIAEDFMDFLAEDSTTFLRKIFKFLNALLESDGSYPLDYIKYTSNRKKKEVYRREQILKNVTSQIMWNIRREKRKPKLMDIVSHGEGDRVFILEKIIEMYTKKKVSSEDCLRATERTIQLMNRMRQKIKRSGQYLEEIGGKDATAEDNQSFFATSNASRESYNIDKLREEFDDVVNDKSSTLSLQKRHVTPKETLEDVDNYIKEILNDEEIELDSLLDKS